MKYLCRLEKDRIKFYRLKKGPRQMVSVAGRLYRTDDRLMVKDTQSSDCLSIYEIEQTQPTLPSPHYVDPDSTRVYIDSAKLAGTKTKVWASLDTSSILPILLFLIVGGTVLMNFLQEGHL